MSHWIKDYERVRVAFQNGSEFGGETVAPIINRLSLIKPDIVNPSPSITDRSGAFFLNYTKMDTNHANI